MERLPKSLAGMIDSLFGLRTSRVISNPVSGTAAANVQIVPNNPRRVGLIILNLSANVVFVGPDNHTSTTRGIWLAANGGSMTLVWDRDFELCATEWWSAAAAAGNQLYVIQVIGE